MSNVIENSSEGKIADVLFSQILRLCKDDKSMKAYMQGDLNIGAVCRNSQDLEMAFIQAVYDPEDPYISLERPPGFAFPLLAGCPPESYGELSKKQLRKLLEDDLEFERLRAEVVLEKLDMATFWKTELASRAKGWLEKRS